jgi:glycine cleavage system regulatory protein
VPNLVLTVVGDDRAGLVKALAEQVSRYGGNWEHSQLAELAGTFAGVVEVSVPEERMADLIAALRALSGLLTITAHPGHEAQGVEPARQLTLNVLGNDHPGIVRDVSAALNSHQLSIDTTSTRTWEAPMAGGRLFEAIVVARVPASADLLALRRDLELVAAEIQVDIDLAD